RVWGTLRSWLGCPTEYAEARVWRSAHRRRRAAVSRRSLARRPDPTRRQPTTRWQRALGGALAVILLLPVPVFAVTWATTGANNVWTLDSSVPSNPTNVSSILGTGYGPLTSPSQPDFLFIQPTVTSNTPTSITLLRDFFPASPNSSGLTATALLNNFSL